MKKTPRTDAMWSAFAHARDITRDTYDVVAFGKGMGLETKLAELIVLAGKKRATAGLLRNFGPEENLPVIGGYVVTVDGSGEPRCIWRTTELRLGRLDSVDERFAWDEGEGDRTRDWWLNAHRQYYSEQAERKKLPFDDGLETVFERFAVVWPPDAADTI
jgi:uncharacterized protein YhfF